MSLAFEVIGLDYRKDIYQSLLVLYKCFMCLQKYQKRFSLKPLCVIFYRTFCYPPGQPKLSVFAIDGLALCLTVCDKVY